jgi:hypothetical protein
MRRIARRAAYCAAALLAWLLLGVLIFGLDAGSRPALSRVALLTSALLIVAPLLTFVPLALYWRAPLFDLEAIAGWGAFGYVFVFLPPRDSLSLAEFLLFVVPLTVALATLFTALAYLAGLRVYRGDPRRQDFVRARRQGYLAALFVVSLAVLNSIDVLTAANGGLLLFIAVLTEALLLARRPAVRVERMAGVAGGVGLPRPPAGVSR